MPPALPSRSILFNYTILRDTKVRAGQLLSVMARQPAAPQLPPAAASCWWAWRPQAWRPQHSLDAAPAAGVGHRQHGRSLGAPRGVDASQQRPPTAAKRRQCWRYAPHTAHRRRPSPAALRCRPAPALDPQDVLVVTAPGSGAEIIPFLKTWVNLPMAIGFTVLYTKVRCCCCRLLCVGGGARGCGCASHATGPRP